MLKRLFYQILIKSILTTPSPCISPQTILKFTKLLILLKKYGGDGETRTFNKSSLKIKNYYLSIS